MNLQPITDLLNRYADPALLDLLTNFLAVDFLRHCNVDALPEIMEHVERLRPDVAAAIRATYPHHAA